MKSKIEEKIRNAREATNEMFAAFEELNEKLSEKLQPEFKRGDYITSSLKLDKWIGILKYPLFKGDGGFGHYAGINRIGELRFEDTPFGLPDRAIVNFSTPEEIALLDSKLAEQGKRFDKEKLELVDIPKHKEPIIGEMAIMWNSNYIDDAICAICYRIKGSSYLVLNGTEYDHAILFESPEQYKAFLKS